MRPYLAIIKDSFREAFHSYVLWIVIGLITVFLLAAALVSYRQTLTVGLRDDEVDCVVDLDEVDHVTDRNIIGHFKKLVIPDTLLRRLQHISPIGQFGKKFFL